MASPSTARLRLTAKVPRPQEWELPLSYKEIEERGGRPFIGGPISLTPDGHPRVRLPLELLPVLADLDLDSDETVVGFIRRFGPLGAWPDGFLLMKEIATFTNPSRLKLRPLVRDREEHAMWGSDRSGEFLDEFRVAAGGLTSLLETVLELEGELDGRRRLSVARLKNRWSPYAPWMPPRSKAEAWWLLVEASNNGLRSAPLTLFPVRDGEVTDWLTRGVRPGPPLVLHQASPENLYGVCILELVDHMLATDRPYRICASETCGRLFSIQEGRSRFGGHRTDTLRYHTPACKAAQESREYRRRQATKKRGGRD